MFFVVFILKISCNHHIQQLLIYQFSDGHGRWQKIIFIDIRKNRTIVFLTANELLILKMFNHFSAGTVCIRQNLILTYKNDPCTE